MTIEYRYVTIPDQTNKLETVRLLVNGVSVDREVLSIGDPEDPDARLSIDATTGAARVQLYGVTEGGGDVRAVSVSDEGHLEVSIQGPRGVFGELITADMTPVVAGDFVYGINSNLASSTLTGSGTATSSSRLGIASTTAAASSTSLIRSTKVAKYRPGQGMQARFTAMFTTGAANSTQIAGLLNSTVDGFGFGYNGASYGVLWRRNSVDTWVARASWNLDVCDGTGMSGFAIDPTKLNIYRIQMGYLGAFGAIMSVLNSYNGQWVEVHQFVFANTTTVPHVTNPSMYFGIYAANAANTTNVAVSTASFFVGVEGQMSRLGGIYGQSSFKSIGTTQNNVITIRNNTTINSVTNRSMLRIRSLSVSTDGTATAIFLCTKNTTLGGSPSYTNVDATNSLAAYDTAGTTITGGTQVFNVTVGNDGSEFCDLTDFDIYLLPGETLTVSAASISGAASNQAVAINWNEDV
jgi:hypothetical protein